MFNQRNLTDSAKNTTHARNIQMARSYSFEKPVWLRPSLSSPSRTSRQSSGIPKSCSIRWPMV